MSSNMLTWCQASLALQTQFSGLQMMPALCGNRQKKRLQHLIAVSVLRILLVTRKIDFINEFVKYKTPGLWAFVWLAGQGWGSFNAYYFLT